MKNETTELVNSMKKITFYLFLLFLSFSCTTYRNSLSETKLRIKCGFSPNTYQSALKVGLNVLVYCDLKSADTVAIIGSQNYYIEILLANINDNLTFFSEDIDTICLNQSTLKNNEQFFKEISKRKVDYRIHTFIGTEKQVSLPYNLNKIFLSKTVHHFNYPTEMLSSMYHHLRKGGRIYVHENIAKKSKDLKCGNYRLTYSELLFLFEKAGFKHIIALDKEFNKAGELMKTKNKLKTNEAAFFTFEK